MDDEILGPLVMVIASLPRRPCRFLTSSDADLLAMQKQRYQQVVRSMMVLSSD
jgi:mannitol operon repressor